MSRKAFTKMVTESADDMLFGETKNPVKLGLDQVAGGGVVYPNIKVAPAEGS
ncbi:MAG TPA: methanol--corrinoid methyltransferase, partial [Methanosphaera sp.]|nr:methanol--corrinoid methyltransferase [Methanosphaera sp.]